MPRVTQLKQRLSKAQTNLHFYTLTAPAPYSPKHRKSTPRHPLDSASVLGLYFPSVRIFDVSLK